MGRKRNNLSLKKMVQYLFLSILLVLSSEIQMVRAQDVLEPDSIAIYGEIADNYVNITYELHFDNTGSSEDREIDWEFGIQKDILLSNLSIILGEKTYIGIVKPEMEAEQEYNESVAANETAVLMKQTAEGYSLQCNLEAEMEAHVFITLEGFLTRKFGGYSLALPLALSQTLLSVLTVDIAIRSNFNPLVSYGIRGLSGLSYTALPTGIQIEYDSGSAILIPSDLELMYRIADQTGGSQLITYTNTTDNFFAYLLAPIIDESTETERQVVFVIDTSGSMGTIPMNQAKIAFNYMIESLNPGDYFNVVEFNTEASSIWSECHPATSENIDEGIAWVTNLESGGSTNFYGGALTGLNSFINDEMPKIMLLLSDGQPNTGTYTTPETIGPAIMEANSLGVSISTIAFTSYVDLDFMGNIASDNSGYFTYITPDSDSASDIFEFYASLSTQGMQEYDITISGATDFAHFRPLSNAFLINGTEVVMTGRFSSQIAITTILYYEEQTENYYNSDSSPGTVHVHVEKLWAQQRISYLLNLISLGNKTFEEEVIQLGMYYGLVIKGYTAMIITTDDEEIPVDNNEWDEDSSNWKSASLGGEAISGYLFLPLFTVAGLIMLSILKKTITKRNRSNLIVLNRTHFFNFSR
ncbi:MAG: VWA domain-containing protein [Promethearchaeota archaeon]